jgi:hypothetical protein
MGRGARAALAAGILIASSPHTSRGDEATKACAASFEQSQYLQKDRKLKDARAAALACSATGCPSFVRDACQKLLADIDTTQPTVVLAAQDEAGVDLALVRVDLDGQPFVSQLGPGAVPIDPGEHTLRFVYGDQPPVEQHVMIRVAEKNRLLRAVFAAPLPTGPDPRRLALLPPALPPRSRSAWPSIVVGTLGLGAIGASVGIGASAKADADNLRSTCAPRCASSDVSSVDTRLVVSDVLLGGGIAVVGVAVVLFVFRGVHGESPAPPVVASPNGGLALAF